MTHRTRKSGFTIVELLVVVSIIALLIALLLPAVARGRDKALISQSVANLKNLASANEIYGGDWNDRQFTACPDDIGLVNGDCDTYKAQRGCPPPQLLGIRGSDGAMWGYWIGSGGKCSGIYPPGINIPTNCGNFVYYVPVSFTAPNKAGSFRMPNVKAFHDYVGKRFYDPVFYAPKDAVALAAVQKYFTQADAFDFDGTNYQDSTYCWSPAAMWDPNVLGRAGNGQTGYKNPNTLPAGFRSPSVARCTYPSMKTRMIEHNWLQNTAETMVNWWYSPDDPTPWQFNHAYNSAPACLFFDGHIELVQCYRAMNDDKKVTGGLYSKDTPWGANGYNQQYKFDRLVQTSFHILTTNGIEGRDVLNTDA